jgi:TolB-like protein/DNA-binding winged helix-turn-helix (wHTH) protein
MERLATVNLLIGAWRVDSVSGQISREGENIRLETRTLRLLLCLAQHAGQVVSINDLLNEVWPGVAVTQDSVYQAVASLRRQLGDDPKQPSYIETVPRLGYRMVASVRTASSPAEPEGGRLTETVSAQRFTRRRIAWLTVAAVCLALAVGGWALFLRSKSGLPERAFADAMPAPPPTSIAVLPFLDLTEGMHEEEFADGMTEELIDRLSKIPGLQVPSATSSFYFKGKQLPVAEIAGALKVRYVLDGSVRKSGGRLRVAARMVRADNGYVEWSESYDRPLHDILMVQDDIAGEVTKALRASIKGTPALNTTH